MTNRKLTIKTQNRPSKLKLAASKSAPLLPALSANQAIAPMAQADRSPPEPIKTQRLPGRHVDQIVIERAGTETMEESEARMAMAPAVASSFLVRSFAAKGICAGRGVDATMAHDVVAHKMAVVSAGDLTELEGMLFANALSLQAASTEFMRRAANCLESPEATEIYMRVALKASGHMRSNLEAIAEIKNPRPVFAKQTNIANGPQQVNNAKQQQVNNDAAPRGSSEIAPIKLLEAQ